MSNTQGNSNQNNFQHANYQQQQNQDQNDAAQRQQNVQPTDQQRENDKQIYTYNSDWVIYALGFSWRQHSDFRLAVGSLKEDLANEVKIIKLSEDPNEDFVCSTTFEHNFPATKVAWLPDQSTSHPDLLATSSDHLRLWEVDEQTNKVTMKSELKENSQNFSAPITSFDWNKKDVSIVGTCSLDTTCTIWDIVKENIKAQLIAHDKEVFDIGFQDTNVFATVGADGSMRMFDLRSLEHSTILYETAQNGVEGKPLLRLGWNNQDPNYIATFEPDSTKVVILDVRVPMVPVSELEGHTDFVDAFSWAPHSSCHICTAGDDKQALIWDLSVTPNTTNQATAGPKRDNFSNTCDQFIDPILSYRADAEITSLQWSGVQPDWVAISFNKTLQMLRV
jgi:WD repeat-containing protein 68